MADKRQKRLTFWNPNTGKVKKISQNDDKAYDRLIESGWELQYFPSSDLDYM